MTAIAGLVHRGRVWLAGDSAISDDAGHVMYTAAPKVWLTPAGMVVGAGGDAAYLDLLTRFEWPARLEDAGPLLRGVPWGDYEGEALLGYRGGLYYLTDHGTIFPVDDSIAAAGSGYGYVMGALAASARTTPEARVRSAVAIASRYCSTVGGRVVVVHT